MITRALFRQQVGGAPKEPVDRPAAVNRPVTREHPDALIVAGGGAKAISALGAIHALHRNGRLTNLKMVAGTSAGAIVAAGVALGRPPLDMCKAFVKDVYAPEFDLQNFSRTFGVDAGGHIARWIDIVLDGQYTFESIREVTGIDLVVCATNLNRRKPAYFSAEKTPTVDVATAIRMSCAIPLYFSAVTLDDEVFVDGAICDNFPYEWVASRDDIECPLGISYTSRDQRGGDVKSLDQYLAALVQCATNQQHTRANANVLELECGDTKVFDFKSPKALKKLFKAGVVQTGEWMKKQS